MMNRTLKLLAMIAAAVTMLAACGDDDNGAAGNGGNDGKDDGGGNYPEITIESATEGEVKAGIADAISIEGSGFDKDIDEVYVGWEENGTTKFKPVDARVLTITAKRVSFGVGITDEIVDKRIRVYLDRIPYDKMPLTEEITFRMPDVAEGYIPDAFFRERLMDASINPDIAAAFDVYGMLSPARAATAEFVDVAGSGVTSLEGIELFTHCNDLRAWDMPDLTLADFSKWKTDVGIFIRIERCPALEKIVAGPTIMRLDCSDNFKLKTLDLSPARWLNNLQMYSNTAGTYLPLETVDLRRQHEGVFVDKDQNETKRDCTEENEYTVIRAGAQFELPGTCRILLDYDQLVAKRTSGNEWNNYSAILSAWKRGAAIDVYSSKDITKKLGTVPPFAEDPDAITPPGQDNGWVPDQTE